MPEQTISPLEFLPPCRLDRHRRRPTIGLRGEYVNALRDRGMATHKVTYVEASLPVFGTVEGLKARLA